MGKIKGWKKLKINRTNIMWKGDDGDKIEVLKKPNYQGGEKEWLVGANGMLHIKKLKTKKEAMASAMNYMRSHPRG